MADKIVAVDENGDYVAIEMSTDRGHFSLTGTSGEVMSETVLNQWHEEHSSAEYLADEYDYLWEEKQMEEYDDILENATREAEHDARREYYDELEKLEDTIRDLEDKPELSDEEQDKLDTAKEELEELEDTTIPERADELAHEQADEEIVEAKERFFEDFANDMEWPQPFELSYDIGSVQVGGEEWYATVESAGQIDMHLTNIYPIGVSREDLTFIFNTWQRYHLEPLERVPPEVISRIRGILDPLDNETQLALVVGRRGAQAGAGVSVGRPGARSARSASVSRGSLGRLKIPPYMRWRS